MGNIICMLDKKGLEAEELLHCHGQRCRNQGRVESHCPRLRALRAGMCHTSSKVSSQGYRTRLPGWQGSYSQCQFSVGTGKLAVATPGASYNKALTPQSVCCQPASQAELETVNACSLRNNERRQELCVSQEVCVPSAAKECPVTRFHPRGWEGG